MYLISLIILVIVCICFLDCKRRDRYYDVVMQQTTEGDTVLDFGAGYCELSSFLGERNPTTNIDTFKGCENEMVYDGFKLPFADNSFDVVVSMFVLHHIPHFKSILDELQRVARKRVIVIEDYPTTILQKLISRVHFLFFHQSMDMIQNMRHPEEWSQLLGGNCTIQRIQSRSFINPTPHFAIVKTY